MARLLYNARNIIKTNKQIIDNEEFINISSKCENIFSLCVIGDTYLVNIESLKESLKSYEKLDIPLIL